MKPSCVYWVVWLFLGLALWAAWLDRPRLVAFYLIVAGVYMVVLWLRAEPTR